MGAIWLLGLPDWLQSAGLPVRVWPGWETRSRSSGGYDRLDAIGTHHSASSATPDNDCAYIWNNSSVRPIGAMLLDRTGRITVGAAGATNTQGKGGPLGPTPQDWANRSWISIEAANAGTGEPWPTVQQDNYVRMCAVIAEHTGIPVEHVWSHFEWTSRKIDQAGPSRYAPNGGKWDMDAFRADVRSAMGGSPPPPPPSGYNPPQDWSLFPLDTNKPWVGDGSLSGMVTSGSHVRYVQDVIFFKGGGNIIRDGQFGPQTRQRVTDLQRVFGLQQSGSVNYESKYADNTWGIIDGLAVGFPDPPPPPPPPGPDDGVVATSHGLYWIREGDSPWSAAERIYGTGTAYPKLTPTTPASPGFSAPNHQIEVSGFPGVSTTVRDGEYPYAILDRMGLPRSASNLDIFYVWNGGKDRVLRPGDVVYMPEAS